MSSVQESSTVSNQQTKSPHEVESSNQMDAATVESNQKAASTSHTEQSGNTSNTTQDVKKNATSNEEKNLKVKDDATSSPPAVSQASSASGDNSNQKNRSPRDYHQSSQNWRKNDQKGTQNRQQKNKKKEEIKVEPLTDATSWPSLDHPKPAEPTTPKKEGSEGKIPKENTPGGDKKKAINWIPFKDALPASTTPSSQNPNSQGEGNGQGSGNQDRRNRGPRNMQNQRRRDSNQQGQQGNRNQNWRNGNNQFRNRNRFPNRGQYPPGYPVVYPIYEGDQLKEILLRQIEYYFSMENLIKDIYLRSQMDEEGWVPLSILANFNRIKSLTNGDNSLIAEVIKNSTIVEYNDEKIRKSGDWKAWLLPKTPNEAPANPIPSSNSQESAQNTPKENQPNTANQQTKTYASLASASSGDGFQKTKFSVKPQQASKQDDKKKVEDKPKASPASSPSISAQNSTSAKKAEQPKEAKKQEAQKPEQPSTESKPAPKESKETKESEGAQVQTEEGEWQTVELKKRRNTKQPQQPPPVSKRGSKELTKRTEETNGVEENHISKKAEKQTS